MKKIKCPDFQAMTVVIDIFSKYAWVQPLKDKGSNEVINAFDKILQEERKPKCLCTDAGREFTNSSFQEYLETKNIVHFTTHSEKQANYVEHFIKTLKSKLYRYMVEKIQLDTLTFFKKW